MSDVGQRKKRLETDAWERHRQIIEHLYLDLGQALEQVMAYMKTTYDFEATEQAYKKKLRRWKISKNIPAPAMEYILAEIDIRHAQGKESTIFWHDRPVDVEKIERSRQRMNREKKENPEKQPIQITSCKAPVFLTRANANRSSYFTTYTNQHPSIATRHRASTGESSTSTGHSSCASPNESI